MRKLLTLSVILSFAALAPTLCYADLLMNGNLDGQSPGDYFDLPAGWSMATNPNSLGPESPPRYPAYTAEFAERTPAPGKFGVIFNSTEGNYPGYEFEGYDAVDGDLWQDVPGTEGQKYRMTGWAYFEGGYAGGVDFIDDDSPTTHAGLPSVTDTFFALEFLDSFGDPLAGSVEIELKAYGQKNNPDQTEMTRNWRQHVLLGVAPLGTVSVRVRASMVDGEFNIDLPHQAAWVDDFSLTAVPEPTTCLLGLLGLAIVAAVRRSR